MLNPFRSSLLSKQNSIKHAFFSRQGGVSQGLLASLNSRHTPMEQKENLEENYKRISAWFGRSPNDLALINQVHGKAVIWLEKAPLLADPPKADAMVTQQSCLILCIRTADCVPVLLYDPVLHIGAAVHAGWRGALLNIPSETVGMMKKQGSDPRNILAALGPCIHQKSFEVREDVFQPFKKMNALWAAFFKEGKSCQHYWFDLPGLVKYQLQTSGVKEIDSLEMDTYTGEENFFSHRRMQHRQEKTYGNQVSAICLE